MVTLSRFIIKYFFMRILTEEDELVSLYTKIGPHVLAQLSATLMVHS
jgi:hypothetical protein